MIYKINNKYYVKTNMHYVEIVFVENESGEVILTPTQNFISLEQNAFEVVVTDYETALKEYYEDIEKRKKEVIEDKKPYKTYDLKSNKNK